MGSKEHHTEYEESQSKKLHNLRMKTMKLKSIKTQTETTCSEAPYKTTKDAILSRKTVSWYSKKLYQTTSKRTNNGKAAKAVEHREDIKVHQLATTRDLNKKTTSLHTLNHVITKHNAFATYFKRFQMKPVPQSCPLCGMRTTVDGFHFSIFWETLEDDNQMICSKDETPDPLM